MSSQLFITGKIIEIYPEQSFASGFTKREFVVLTNDRYPQPIRFELLKERCAQLDEFVQGDLVEAHFNLRGNEYQGRYFVSLVCWRLVPAEGEASGSTKQDYPPSTAGSSVSQSAPATAAKKGFLEDDDDEIPF